MHEATLIYRRTREQRNFSSDMPSSSTVRYLGIEVDDALEIAEQTAVILGGSQPPKHDGRDPVRSRRSNCRLR